MSSNPSDPAPRPAGLQSMLARLRGMVQALKTPETPDEPSASGTDNLPGAAAPSAEPPAEAAPVSTAVPLATPVEAPWWAEQLPSPALAATGPARPAEPVSPAGRQDRQETPPPIESAAAPTAPLRCPACQSPRTPDRTYCDSCGYFFPPDLPAAPAAAAPAVSAPANVRVGGRYELRELASERLGVSRFRGLDHGVQGGPPIPVVILRAALPPPAEPVAETDLAFAANPDDEVLPGFDVPAAPTSLPTTTPETALPGWPSLAWERALLETANHPSLPAVLDYLCADGFEYLVEELPAGESLWNAWDDPEADARKRFGLLKQVAEGLHALHQAGVIVEGLRPDIVVVTPEGRARLTDLSDLLPLPVPADAPIRGTLYTAPELVGNNTQADARADLYSFGAMLYALHVGRELTDNDFDKKTRAPKPFIPFFPDVHPAFGRLMTKTFVRELSLRFPTDEAGREDPTGFSELIHTLDACGRTLDNVRLEVAAWTTTGMVRTGNEDAFALLHGIESRQDDLGECALVLLADGMGGYEAGEVAAALAIQALRRNLVQQGPFQALAGASPFPSEVPAKDADPPAPLDVEECKQLLLAALKDANQQVYQAPRNGVGRRGMGCTAEVVYVDGRNVVVGHVGDSRTYHLHEGRLIQLTRDQTLVNRLVELGQLTAEEAEDHPRKNELQQAIGGQPFVEPGLYHGKMSPGDWVIVCSDGLSNHIKPEELKEMLLGEAGSAETAARRLTNLVNLKGATDNSTIVVIRAT